MNETHNTTTPPTDDRPKASRTTRLIVMGVLFIIAWLSIWSIDGRVLTVMEQHAHEYPQQPAE